MIKPWTGYITVVNVEHEDHVERVETPQMVQMITGIKQVEQQQGISAGIVESVGQGVDGLEPGVKVYYAMSAAIVIGEVVVVGSHYVIAYEDTA